MVALMYSRTMYVRMTLLELVMKGAACLSLKKSIQGKWSETVCLICGVKAGYVAVLAS